MLGKMYMIQSTVLFLIGALYLGAPKVAVALLFRILTLLRIRYVGESAANNELAQVFIQCMGATCIYASGLMCTASKIHTTGMNKAVAIGHFVIGGLAAFYEFGGKADSLGILPNMGPIPVRGTLFWAVYHGLSGICFFVGGAAADGGKKKTK